MPRKKSVIPHAAAVVVLVVLAAAVMYSIDPPLKTFSDIVEQKEFEKTSDLFYNYEISRYPSRAEVVDLKAERTLIGFDIDPDKLNFGSVPTNGSYSSKTINFTGIVRDSRIRIMTRGGIAPYVTIDNSDFMIGRGKEAQVGIVFGTRKGEADLPIGNYTGEIDIIVQNPKYEFMYWMWNK